MLHRQLAGAENLYFMLHGDYRDAQHVLRARTITAICAAIDIESLPRARRGRRICGCWGALTVSEPAF